MGALAEHGLHNLFGFYDHTFRLMRGVYDELRVRHGIDRGGFMDAAAPESAAVFVEEIGGEARPWHIHNPTNSRIPGDDGPLSLAEAVRLALDFLPTHRRMTARRWRPRARTWGLGRGRDAPVLLARAPGYP